MTAKVLSVREGGAELAIPRDVAERSGLQAGDELALFAPGGGVMLLVREAGEAEKARRGFFAGTLEALSVAEVFGFICSAIRSGKLLLRSGPVRRTLHFRDGQLVAASSTEPSERLGPVLWREGLITRDQLEHAGRQVRTGRKFGQVLTEEKVLSPAELFRGIQLQVREIGLAVFGLAEGELAFIEEDPADIGGLKLPERTRDLVLAGIQRADRLQTLRLRFDARAVPAWSGLFDSGAVDAHQTALLGCIDGVRNAGTAVNASLLGEYAGLVALSGLVEAGWVQLADAGLEIAAPVPGDEPEGAEGDWRIPGTEGLSPLELYDAAIRHICGVLEDEGEPSERLNGFFRKPPGHLGALFEGVSLAGGALEVERVQKNAVRAHSEPMARALALEALDVFVSFALFDVANILPEETAAKLARQITRTLLGR